MGSIDIKEMVKRSIKEKIRKGDIKCPNCGRKDFDVSIRKTAAGIEGGAICRSCETRIDLKTNKEAQRAIKNVQKSINELEETLDGLGK